MNGGNKGVCIVFLGHQDKGIWCFGEKCADAIGIKRKESSFKHAVMDRFEK